MCQPSGTGSQQLHRGRKHVELKRMCTSQMQLASGRPAAEASTCSNSDPAILNSSVVSASPCNTKLMNVSSKLVSFSYAPRWFNSNSIRAFFFIHWFSLHRSVPNDRPIWPHTVKISACCCEVRRGNVCALASTMPYTAQLIFEALLAEDVAASRAHSNSFVVAM